MSLRENLIKPFVVEASKGHHLYTIIFLHRLPQDTPPDQLPAKLLSEKLTKNHKTLAEQFPTIRWVFPYPKLHHDNDHDAKGGRLKNQQHWSNLSAKDRANLELPFGSDLPYITQIIIQEAKLAGGLDKIILGGQGESAIAAHDASTAFPELAQALRQQSRDVEKAFLGRFFHNPGWIDLSQLRMAGFVGMHAQAGPPTRDESDYLLSRRTTSGRVVNHTILRQTPHKFIRGGYKTQTITWDGARIDAFAAFLTSLGIIREGCDIKAPPSPEPSALTPKARPATEAKPPEEKPGMTPQERHRLEILEDKKSEQETRRRTLMRIEEDKRNRRYRKERERAARQHAAAAGQDSDDMESIVASQGDSRVGSVEPASTPSTSTSTPRSEHQRSATVLRQYEQRPKAWEDWPTMPDELREEGWQPRPRQGEGMSESQLRALGIPKKEKD